MKIFLFLSIIVVSVLIILPPYGDEVPLIAALTGLIKKV
jgi:hypothetical protein